MARFRFSAKLLLLPTLAALAGCAGIPRVYQLEVGARYDIYKEEPDQSLDSMVSQILGQPVFVLEGDPNKIETQARGFHIGVTELMINRLISRMVLYYSKYDPVKYTFQVPTIGRVEQELDPYAVGLDAALGYQIGWFRPQLSYKYQSFVMESVIRNPGGTRPESTSRSSSSQFLIGGGLALHIPFSKAFNVITEVDYRIPLYAQGSIREWTLQAGIRLGHWEMR